jgi:hypothetical protein
MSPLHRQKRTSGAIAELAFDVTQSIDPWFSELEPSTTDTALLQFELDDVANSLEASAPKSAQKNR